MFNIKKKVGNGLKRLIIVISSLTILLCFFGCESESKTAATKQKDNEVKYEGATIEINDKYKKWNVAPEFKYQTKGQDGGSLTYEVIGNRAGFGITGQFPIVSGEKQKYFWFYWGKENIKNQPVKVMAYKKGSKELINVFEGEFYVGAQINKDEVNMPSNLKFPSSGVWNVLIFINDKLSGNIVVNVI
jgi:hypothetical protein